MRTPLAIPAKNALVTNLADKTATLGMDEDGRKQLVADATTAIRDVVYPAYRRMIAEEQKLRPRATHDAGLWRLKGGSSYYFRLEPWGPQESEDDVRVSQSFYDAKQPGDFVCIGLRDGALNMPWYFVRDCR